MTTSTMLRVGDSVDPDMTGDGGVPGETMIVGPSGGNVKTSSIESVGDSVAVTGDIAGTSSSSHVSHVRDENHGK